MSRLGLLAALALVATACDYGGPEASDEVVPECGERASTGVDTGAELDIVPGDGAGAFIEYLDDGSWRVTTTCDSGESGSECYWDVFVWPTSADDTLLDFVSQSIEAGDAIGYEYDGALHLVTSTGSDTDGVLFDATPGAALNFEIYLDGYCGSPYTFWIGDGAVHGGAPGNPLELVPSE
jgi:hypothetical protein